MKKLALIALLVALALPASALAKGPSKAMIVGPGLTTIRISGAEGSSTPFWHLVEVTGWFEAAYGTGVPGVSRLPEQPPDGELGPRYTITWSVPSSGKLHQEVYPHAKPSPLAYMPPGQKIYGQRVKGGWFVGGAKLKRALVHLGVPAQTPEQHPAGQPTAARPSSGSGLSTLARAGIGAGALILAVALAFGVRARRRPRPVAG